MTVDAIVEAAAHILETAGFAGYTTNAIAERAGACIGSLYQYFPNKEAVTLALIERESTALLRDIQAAASLADWREALDAMVAATVRHQLRRPVLARLLDLEETLLPAEAMAAPGAGPISAAVRSALARTDVEHCAPIDQMAADLMGITRGVTDMAGRAGELDAANLKRRVRQAVFGYLLGQGGKGARIQSNA